MIKLSKRKPIQKAYRNSKNELLLIRSVWVSKNSNLKKAKNSIPTTYTENHIAILFGMNDSFKIYSCLTVIFNTQRELFKVKLNY